MEIIDCVKQDLQKYEQLGGIIKYPFPIEDFALKVFGLDIQYEDFNNVFTSSTYDPQELFGCLFPDHRYFQGLDKTILINSNRKPFILAGKEINKAYWEDYSERQTIAHEIGHYSDLFVHNPNSNPEAYQLDLFEPTIFADAPTSIIVYPKNEEKNANKYAKILLMPEEKVQEFITKKGIVGTFDINSIIQEIKEYFGVTQFMIEIRLNELGIHFYNGVYIKKTNRFPYKKYSEENLLCLIDIIKKYGLQHPYYDADNFTKQYNLATGETRASAALYYAVYRILQGKYDEKYPSVFEKRIAELSDDSLDEFIIEDVEDENN